jgi:hypothetical protein
LVTGGNAELDGESFEEYLEFLVVTLSLWVVLKKVVFLGK